MKITIDPRLKYNYASWYLLGIEILFKKHDIDFSILPFKQLEYSNTKEYNSGFAFVVEKENKKKKIFIDTEDVAVVYKDRYDWCDIYGMVNPTKEQVEKNDKLIAIGPEFGITVSSKLCTIFNSIRMYLKGVKHSQIPFRTYLKDYLYTNVRRRPIELYERKEAVVKNYIFHASTLWYNQFAAKSTNKYRGDFLITCKEVGMIIEGGLFYIGDSPVVLSEMPDYPNYKKIYKDFIYNKRLSINDYILKTKQSVFVFNTPSVCECHGWKLAEYLCMGKAIISTPLTREMPYPLKHGENIHFVRTKEELYDAVVKIKTDNTYRERLEKGAREYYEKWLAPNVVITRLIEIAYKKA